MPAAGASPGLLDKGAISSADAYMLQEDTRAFYEKRRLDAILPAVACPSIPMLSRQAP